MQSHQQALSAYSSPHQLLRPSRRVEYEAFVQVTRRLMECQTENGRDFGLVAQAIHLNQRLWNILAADVAQNENALPQELRGRIFYLAEFTQVQSRKVLRKTGDVKPLVDVNKAIMRGLNPTPENREA